MTQANVAESGSDSSILETAQYNHRTRTPINRILERLSQLDLPEKEHFENYLRYKWRANHKPRTIDSSFTSIRLLCAELHKSRNADSIVMRRKDL